MSETIAKKIEELNPETIVKSVSAASFGINEALAEITELAKEIRLGRFDQIRYAKDLESELFDWKFHLRVKYGNAHPS